MCFKTTTLSAFFLIGLTSLSLGIAAQEQGQYRSKIVIMPDDAWSKDADLSNEELERQLGSIEDAYAKSSAGRHLARHYVERKEYEKAVEFYRGALSAQGLSAIANREMLRELAQVQLLKKDYAAAVETLQQALALNLVSEVNDYLLLARAQHQRGKYVDVVATLDRINEAGLTLDLLQMQQALALYYRAGAYAQCEVLLGRLLELQPDEAQHWHMLTSVYLQQNKKKKALDQLVLAQEKRVPFSERDILLLANLQAANNNPYGAAETLDKALSQQQVAVSGTNYRKLFEFWLQAREQDRAHQALKQAARLTGDTELYLHLAQLQMEAKDFQNMHQTILKACAKTLADKYVGRANLLLGISQLKMGDEAAARRSFINASLVGGVNAQAGQWLGFMNAAPPTERETRRIESICYGSNDTRLDSSSSAGASLASDAALSDAEKGAGDSESKAGDVQVKTVPSMRLFYMNYDKPLAEMMGSLRGKVVSMGVNLAKSGGVVDGPLQIIFSGDIEKREVGADLQIGLPTRGAVSSRGQFRVRSTEPYKCAYITIEEPETTLLTRLADLAAAAQAAGFELSGEGRLVISPGDNADTFSIELQLGVQ